MAILQWCLCVPPSSHGQAFSCILAALQLIFAGLLLLWCFLHPMLDIFIDRYILGSGPSTQAGTRMVLWPLLTPHDKFCWGHGRQVPSSSHVREAFPGKNPLFLFIDLPHPPFGIPSGYATSVYLAILSIPNGPYAVSVRQVRDLPAPSFRFHLTMSPLVFGYDFPMTRAVQGLSPLRVRPCRAHNNYPPA